MLTVLKIICKTKDFLRRKKKKSYVKCFFSLFTRHFPTCSIFGVFLPQSKAPFIAVVEGYLLMFCNDRIFLVRGLDLTWSWGHRISHGFLIDVPYAFKNDKDSIRKCFWNYRKKILKQRCCPKQILFKGILKRYILLYQRTYMYLPTHSVSL